MLVDILEQPRFHSVFSSAFERMAAFGQYVLKIKPCRQKLAMNIFNNMRPLQLLFHNASTYARPRCGPSMRMALAPSLQNRVSWRQTANFSSLPKGKKSSSSAGPISWKSLLVFALAGGGVWYYVRHLKEEKEKIKEAERNRSVGMASLGGPFELVDQDGNPKTDKDFLGQWLLIYFGFCHCPDICPDQLEKMTTIIELLDKTEGIPKIQPLFITVDPHRDDPKSVKEYLQDFHPRLIGLTGTEEQIKSVTKAYRVYYSAGPMDDDEDYIVDHTIITYLVNPEGKFIEYFGQNKSIEEIKSTIGTRMISYRYAKH